ncbi:unnamed protein product, partial [marine sediment metagenome]
FLHLDENNELISANLSEYYSSYVKAPFFINIYMLVRREQVLERIK